MSLTDPGIRPIDTWGPEQEAQVAAASDEWLRIALATDPADRPAAEEAVRRAYRASGLSAPAQMIWLGSPLAGAIAAAILSITELSDHTPDEYWRAVRSQLQHRLRQAWVQPPLDFSGGGDGLAPGRFGAPVGNQVRGPLAEAVRHTFQEELQRRFDWSMPGVPVDHNSNGEAGGPVPRGTGWRLDELIRRGIQPAAALGWRLRDLIQEVVEPLALPFLMEGPDEFEWESRWDARNVIEAVWGQPDADWLAHVSAVRRLVPGAADIRGLDDLMRVARCAGWWWPFERLVILTERPTAIQLDGEGRLHSADGPAVTYPDGLSIWSWQGVTVPRHVIEEPERITARQIQRESNVEVRHIMLERYGADRYLRVAGAERVSSDDTGILWCSDMGDGIDAEPLVMVEVRNSTPEPDGSHKHYWLRVPPHIRSAREGVAWTFGLPTGDYRPLVES